MILIGLKTLVEVQVKELRLFIDGCHEKPLCKVKFETYDGALENEG